MNREECSFRWLALHDKLWERFDQLVRDGANFRQPNVRVWDWMANAAYHLAHGSNR